MMEYGDTYLLAPFREFYREVMRLRDMADTGTLAAAADAAADFNSPAGAGVYIPEVVPDAEPEASFARDSAWELKPASASWETPEPRDGNGLKLSGANGDVGANNGGAQLVPAGDMRESTYVLQSLVSLLKRQEAQAVYYGGAYGAEFFYKEAQYVMVALADEIFLNTKRWDGGRTWVSNLLESRMFSSHFAGDDFFRKLDSLLVKRDPVYRDLAAVYLMALSLGFEGKYRDGSDRRQLENYRRQLFHFVFRRPADLDSESRRHFPEAYDQMPRDETKRKLTNPRAWVILLCAVVVAYVALTHGIWSKLTSRLFEVNERIQKTVDRMGNGL
jgi:type VI secretion system protein ImpK